MSATLLRGAERTRPLVLHVIESLGGGVLSAVRDYLASTPDYDHVVLAREREGHDTGEAFDGLALAVRGVPDRMDRAMVVVGRTYRELRPDVVHAHSSFGGVWARTSGIPADRIVYTPHCFAFEREDQSSLRRGLFRGIERALSTRTAVVAAVSPREADLARDLRRGTIAVHVPNVARVPVQALRRRARSNGSSTGSARMTVVAAGRLCEQKDPGFFAAMVDHAAEAGVAVDWRWLGGGSDEDEAALRERGVDVTGWIPRQELLSQLGDADVYVHTAAWEGAPITVLEAAALGVPVVARRIPPLTALGLERLADTPADLAAAVLQLQDPSIRRRGATESVALSSRHRPGMQADALDEVYRTVLSGSVATTASGAERRW